VLIVEDDAELRALLVRALEEEEFEVAAAATAADGLRAWERRPADVVVLDIGLPDADGRDLCGALRARGERVPVLFLTARDALADRLAGFDAGGDDYVTKPFSLVELTERVRALARRAAPRPALQHGDLRLDRGTHAVERAGARSVLTPTELRVLAALMERAGEPVRRRELALAGWPDGDAVQDNALDACISRLRRKLARLGADGALETVHGTGYRLRG
jgi:two-component system response regulator MprA